METLMFYSQIEAKNIYGNREVDYVLKYHMDIFSFQNFSYGNINYYDNLSFNILTVQLDCFLLIHIVIYIFHQILFVQN